MSTSTEIIFYAAGFCIVGCIAIVTMLMGGSEVVQVSDHGERGYQRQIARRSSTFVIFEPALRLVATWISWIPLGPLRGDIDALLGRGGNYLGLTADEFLAMSTLTGFCGMLMAAQVFPVVLAMLMAGFFCALIPFLLVSNARDAIDVAITRALPTSIELIALCVSAGMDFAGAVREVIGYNAEVDDALNREYRLFLRDLDLGHSRKQALRAFGERVSGDGVSDFVAALIQSEEKGNPLKSVLAAQAKVLRVRRSFRAEEMATQAGVKMVVPLAILMFMVLIIIISPLILKMQEQGF
ncbi:MAG: type II secretion system F family protein [Myxococcales bacterium]|nr:type II secretion system F family protein [Myxococcales bacterium]